MPKKYNGKLPGIVAARLNVRAAKEGIPGKVTTNHIRTLILNRDFCPYCGGSLENDYHFDHIKAKSIGGTNTDDNLQIICSFCNRAKANHTEEQFLAWINRLRSR